MLMILATAAAICLLVWECYKNDDNDKESRT